MRNYDDVDPEDDEYVEVDKETLDNLKKEAKFEYNFYKYICNSNNFEVIPVPDEKGKIITKEEIKYFEDIAKKEKIKLLYRISHGTFATVFDPKTGRVGVMPESNDKGFTC